MEEFEDKKINKLIVFGFASLAFGLVSTITYALYNIFTHHSMLTIVSSIILFIITGLLVIAGYNIENKKARIFISIAGIIIGIYTLTVMIIDIATPKYKVIGLTDMDIKDVIEWANDRNITIRQKFAYNDDIAEYHVISQDIEKGTKITKNMEINVMVSNGSDPNSKAEVTNMVGWKLDDVIAFIDENHLTNVTINFEFSNTVKKDIIISQDVVKEIRRNEPITLVSSLGRESQFPTVTLDNLVGLDTFHLMVYLGRNHLKYNIVYSRSDKEEGTVIKQSPKKWTVISPNSKDEITVTISKQNEVTVPNFNKMTETEITEWAIDNRIKVDYEYKYDDTIKEGKIISCNYKKGTNITNDDIVKIVFSKGTLRMIEFTDIDSFREWAKDKEVIYNIDYEFNEVIPEGELISSTHEKGDIIKNNDTVNLIISEGGTTTVPNLIDLTKDEANKKCKENKLKCNFIYLDNNIDYTIVTKQSMRSGSNVPQNTSINVTLGK